MLKKTKTMSSDHPVMDVVKGQSQHLIDNQAMTTKLAVSLRWSVHHSAVTIFIFIYYSA